MRPGCAPEQAPSFEYLSLRKLLCAHSQPPPNRPSTSKPPCRHWAQASKSRPSMQQIGLTGAEHRDGKSTNYFGRIRPCTLHIAKYFQHGTAPQRLSSPRKNSGQLDRYMHPSRCYDTIQAMTYTDPHHPGSSDPCLRTLRQTRLTAEYSPLTTWNRRGHAQMELPTPRKPAQRRQMKNESQRTSTIFGCIEYSHKVLALTSTFPALLPGRFSPIRARFPGLRSRCGVPKGSGSHPGRRPGNHRGTD